MLNNKKRNICLVIMIFIIIIFMLCNTKVGKNIKNVQFKSESMITGDFKEGLAYVGSFKHVGFGFDYISKGYFIDKTGKIVINKVKTAESFEFSDGMFPINTIKGFGFIDKNGRKTIVNDVYIGEVTAGNKFSEGFLAVESSKNYNVGYIDKKGKAISAFEYDTGSEFSEGLAKVTASDKSGYIDKTGEVVIDIKYSSAGDFKEGLAPVCDDGCGFINKKEDKIIDFNYKDTESFSEGLAAVKKYDKWGFIDKNENVVIDFKYDEVKPFKESLAAVKKYDKWGFIDRKGNLVVDFKYDRVESFSEGFAVVKENEYGKYGYIDKKGNVVIDFKYNNASSFSETLAAVEEQDKYSYIDKNGEEKITINYTNPKSLDPIISPIVKIISVGIVIVRTISIVMAIIVLLYLSYKNYKKRKQISKETLMENTNNQININKVGNGNTLLFVIVFIIVEVICQKNIVSIHAMNLGTEKFSNNALILAIVLTVVFCFLCYITSISKNLKERKVIYPVLYIVFSKIILMILAIFIEFYTMQLIYVYASIFNIAVAIVLFLYFWDKEKQQLK